MAVNTSIFLYSYGKISNFFKENYLLITIQIFTKKNQFLMSSTFAFGISEM